MIGSKFCRQMELDYTTKFKTPSPVDCFGSVNLIVKVIPNAHKNAQDDH